MLRTQIKETDSFSDFVSEVSLAQKDCYRRGSLFTDQLIEEMYKTRGGLYYSVTLSYMPFLNFASYNTCLNASVIDSGMAIQPLYVIIMPSSDGKSLDFIYKYAKNYTKPESIEKFHAFMLKFLEAGIKDPERTIKDLVDECI